MDEGSLMRVLKIRRCGTENKKIIIQKDNSFFFNKSLRALDPDLRNLVKYNESNKTLTINTLSSNDNWLSICYSDTFNKFIIQTNEAFCTFNSINYVIKYETRSRFRHYLLNIGFTFNDKNKSTYFQLINEVSNQFDNSFFEQCKKESSLDYSGLNYYNDSSFFDEFEYFHKNKISQIKKVLDEFIKSREPNLKYLSCKTKSKKCIVKKL
jgi:hypothetical protein